MYYNLQGEIAPKKKLNPYLRIPRLQLQWDHLQCRKLRFQLPWNTYDQRQTNCVNEHSSKHRHMQWHRSTNGIN